MRKLALMFLITATPALAQQIPDDAIKGNALKRGLPASAVAARQVGA